MPIPTLRRLVLVFPGFEPLTAESTARRFLRGLEQSAPLYELTSSASDLVAEDLGNGLRAACFDVQVQGKGTAETTVVVYGLDAINKAYSARGTASRIVRGCMGQLDFLANGTFFRYVATSWRYALFFLFPLLVCCAIGLLGVMTFSVLSRFGSILASLAAAGLSLVLLFLADRRFHLRLLMDDWAFASDLARGRNEWLNGLLDAVNADAAKRIEAFDGDEVLLAGHSLGVVPAVSTLANAMRRAPSRLTVPALGLLTVGSSLLKIALHPAAAWVRRDIKAVARSAVPWLEVQSVSDPISFYRSDPVETLRLGPAGRVRIMRISLRKQMEPQTFKAFRFNMFKLHRQFVRAIEKRSAYSFHVILCGPAPFASLVEGKRVGLATEPSARKG